VFPEEVVRGMIKNVKKVHEEFVREESLKYWLTLPKSNTSVKGKRNLKEFEGLWKWRCPEKRRHNVVQWTSSCVGRTLGPREQDRGEGTSERGYWDSGAAIGYSIRDLSIDTSEWGGYEEEQYFNMKERGRRHFLSKWYDGIHEGRYFLFFKENDIWTPDLFDEYKNEGFSICGLSSWSQVAQDLLTIDGPGLGEKAGGTIDHIDDLLI
jgi:hypothetical protein